VSATPPGGPPYARPAPVATAQLGVPDGRVLHATHAWGELLAAAGRTPAAIADQPWAAWWFGDPSERPVFEDVVRSSEPRRLRPLTLDHRGRRSVWECLLIPLHAARAAGTLDGVLLACTEVTDLAIERQHLEERARALDDLLARSWVQLRGPLAPLATWSQVLRRMLEEPRREPVWNQQVGRALASFDRNLRALELCMDDVRDLAALEQGAPLQLQTLELVALLEAIAARIQAGPGLPGMRVEREPSAGGRLIGDPQWLGRAVQALAGDLWMRVAAPPDLCLRASAAGAAPRVARLEVTAGESVELPRTGPGRPRDDPSVELAFLLARHVAERHGGRAGSDRTRYWIEIPMMEG
jgi:signal transduction histidine kinase